MQNVIFIVYNVTKKIVIAVIKMSSLIIIVYSIKS